MDAVPVRLLWILLVTVFVALLRCIENALEEANEAKFQRLSEEGDKKAKRVAYLIDNYPRIYNMISFLVSACQIFTAAYMVFVWGKFFEGSPVWTLILAEVVYALVIYILGMYIPKKIAFVAADEISQNFSGFILLLFKIALPILTVPTLIAKGIMCLFKIKDKEDETDITEEEIKLMVEIGSQSGAIDPEEKEMIHNIFEMGETPANNIMTHRIDVDFLWLEDSIGVWEETISKGKHSVYPVCGETVDNIVGIINSKDFYRKLLKNRDFNVKSILKAPVFVPGSVKADELFKKMQQAKNHFVIVLDEYGGMAGVITMSDMLEEIVGNFEENEEPEIIKKEDNTWIIKGTADLDEVAESLGVKLPTEEYNTLAGMILSQIGTIPEDGTKPEFEMFGLNIKVIRIKEHRIEKTLIRLLQREDAENEK